MTVADGGGGGKQSSSCFSPLLSQHDRQHTQLGCALGKKMVETRGQHGVQQRGPSCGAPSRAAASDFLLGGEKVGGLIGDDGGSTSRGVS